jgi:hypothetical protein
MVGSSHRSEQRDDNHQPNDTMNYTVTTRRSIPASETHTSLILKKTVTTDLVNGGKLAVCVKLQDGRMAWGFGISETEAEAAAVVAAMSI